MGNGEVWLGWTKRNGKEKGNTVQKGKLLQSKCSVEDQTDHRSAFLHLFQNRVLGTIEDFRNSYEHCGLQFLEVIRYGLRILGKKIKYKIFENGRGREKDSKEMRERYLPHGRIQYARLCVRMRAWWCVQKCAREGDTRDDVCRGEYRKLELFLRAPRPNSRA